MKNLLILLSILLSTTIVFSQSNSHNSLQLKSKNWSNGAFNKRILKTHFETIEADSLSKIIRSHINGFYCQGSSCEFLNIDDDYYISVKMNNGFLKIKYYFGNFDALKIDNLILKIENYLN